MKITITPAVLEAGARAIKYLFVNDCPATYDEIARAAFDAMVAAWPGMMMADHPEWALPAILLPLSTENPDAEA